MADTPLPQPPDRADEARLPRRTRQQLIEDFAQLGSRSALVEEPLDGELWPTEGLSDRQVAIFADRLLTLLDRVEET